MGALERFISRGWRFLDGRSAIAKGRRKIVCPHNGCGLCLTVSNATNRPDKSSVFVDSVQDFAMEVVNRRADLGLSTDDVDYIADLGARHTQKIEDVGRQIVEGDAMPTRDLALSVLSSVLEELDENSASAEKIQSLLAKSMKNVERHSKFQGARVPRLDTIYLVVQALGGKLNIVWGDLPPIAKSLRRKASENPQQTFKFDQN